MHWITRDTPPPPPASRKELRALEPVAKNFDAKWRRAGRLHDLIRAAQTYVQVEAGTFPEELQELPDFNALSSWIIPSISALVSHPELTHPNKKSIERSELWDPLMRLMMEYGVGFHQHGHLIVTIRELHAFAGIEPPKDGSVRAAELAFKKQLAMQRRPSRTRR
ncbi:hypothetical protein QA640_44140 (plasmid) [Bradyrhizobium sp. CB82]|uniref:hypothetical protein n=1 Tax=Bradyrhizobium sp. CB82 TaxID=3039159 RepID=UPI0024B0BBCB|nr:hypothetical protein [Bradyrhizobium sp. CB82]WFU45822.1 hypothetical protein QA640_44140 [Bradyrhizobium sp. CB82]